MIKLFSPNFLQSFFLPKTPEKPVRNSLLPSFSFIPLQRAAKIRWPILYHQTFCDLFLNFLKALFELPSSYLPLFRSGCKGTTSFYLCNSTDENFSIIFLNTRKTYGILTVKPQIQLKATFLSLFDTFSFDSRPSHYFFKGLASNGWSSTRPILIESRIRGAWSYITLAPTRRFSPGNSGPGFSISNVGFSPSEMTIWDR